MFCHNPGVWALWGGRPEKGLSGEVGCLEKLKPGEVGDKTGAKPGRCRKAKVTHYLSMP